MGPEQAARFSATPPDTASWTAEQPVPSFPEETDP